jgi:hypothetical protein
MVCHELGVFGLGKTYSSIIVSPGATDIPKTWSKIETREVAVSRNAPKNVRRKIAPPAAALKASSRLPPFFGGRYDRNLGMRLLH